MVILLLHVIPKKATPKKVENEKDDSKIIWIRLPYLGNIGDSLKKNCFRKVQKCLKENVRFITCYETKKTAMFVQLRIAFQYTKKQTLSTKSLALVVMKITLEKLIESWLRD